MTVHGSHGTLTIDDMGVVVDYDPSNDATEYADIVCFDLAEYQETYGPDGATSFDILDVGFWTETGEYVAADEDHRQMVRENAQSITLSPAAAHAIDTSWPGLVLCSECGQRTSPEDWCVCKKARFR